MKEKDKQEILNIDSSLYSTKLSRNFKNRIPYKAADPLTVLSFIPGTILEILVKPGQQIKKGNALMILEAMKMQNMLKSAIDGRIKRIVVKKGEKVSKGTKLIEME